MSSQVQVTFEPQQLSGTASVHTAPHGTRVSMRSREPDSSEVGGFAACDRGSDEGRETPSVSAFTLS